MQNQFYASKKGVNTVQSHDNMSYCQPIFSAFVCLFSQIGDTITHFFINCIDPNRVLSDKSVWLFNMKKNEFLVN